MFKPGNAKGKGTNLKLPNPLETVKDIANDTAKQMRQEASKLPADFMDQLFGVRPQRSYSGEITPGEVVEFKEVFSGQHEEQIKLKKQISFERRLLEEEKIQVEKKTNELRIQLHAVREEILVLAQKTDSLAQETQIAAMQAPVEPGLYHVIFFEKLLEFIKSFRQKIDEAGVWLQAVNRRSAKKNSWVGRYQKHGAKYLLSSEHYLQRSAG